MSIGNAKVNRTKKQNTRLGHYVELLYERTGRRRDFSQPLKPTMNSVQQKAKHVNATATLRNIMTSEREHIKKTDTFLITLILTISASAHSGNSDFFRGKIENKTTTRKEKASESLSRWSGRKDRLWRA
jgi:hypothetical protein